jgi:hypothetical protein
MDNNLNKELEEGINQFKDGVNELQVELDNNPNHEVILPKINQTLDKLDKIDNLLELEINKIKEFLEDNWDNDDSK